MLAVGTECDVALLAVDDAEFWAGVAPVAFGGLPHLQDDVHVVGYPIGGDTISVTSGVVSRIEVTAYAHGATDLLGVQVRGVVVVLGVGALVQSYKPTFISARSILRLNSKP